MTGSLPLPPEDPDVSIILTTRNGAEHLPPTLASLAHVALPPALRVEVLLVDNGSTDATAEIFRGFRWGDIPVRVLHAPEPGLARAQNVALRGVAGRVVLFLDDDVRPPANWIEAMSVPILQGSADAVGGGVRIADEVKPPWMRPEHEEWFASTEHWEPNRPPVLVGASMAVGRHVFSSLGGFDENLRHAPDTVFSCRLLQRGFRLQLRHDIVTLHFVKQSRFSRDGIRHQARLRGESEAYLLHHFGGTAPRGSFLREWRAKSRLARLRRELGALTDDNVTLAEMRLMQRVSFWPEYRRIRRTPRRYAGSSSAVETFTVQSLPVP